MQSSELLVVGRNIYLWTTLGLIFSKTLYFVMVDLQFSVVCLVMILCALVLVFFPILVISSIHARNLVGLIGSTGFVLIVVFLCQEYYGGACRGIGMQLLWPYGYYNVFSIYISIFLLCSKEETSLGLDPIRYWWCGFSHARLFYPLVEGINKFL